MAFKFFKKKSKSKPIAVQRRLTKKNKKNGSNSPTDSEVGKFLETNRPASTAPIPEPQGEWVSSPAGVPQDSLGAVVPSDTVAVQELDSGATRKSTTPVLVREFSWSTPLDWPAERQSGLFSSGAVERAIREQAQGSHSEQQTPAPTEVEVSVAPTPSLDDVSQSAASPAQEESPSWLSQAKSVVELPAHDHGSTHPPSTDAVELPAHDAASVSLAESVTDVPDEHSVSSDPHATALHELSQSLHDLRANQSPQRSCSKDSCSNPPLCKAPPASPLTDTAPTSREVKRIAPWFWEGEAAALAVDHAQSRNTIAPGNLDEIPLGELSTSPATSDDSNTKSGASSTPSSDSSLNASSPTDITFLVGAQEPSSRYLTPQYFQIPAHFLQRSKMLAKYQRWVHKHGSRSPPTIRLPDLDPKAFGLWCAYTASGTIDAGEAIASGIWVSYDCLMGKWRWVALWPLINAHILASTLGDARFGEYILGLLRENVVKRQTASIETITHVFGAIDVSEDLKRFLVEEAIDGGVKNFTSDMIAKYPSAFIGMALERTVEILETVLNKGKREVEAESRVGVGALKKMKNEMTRAVVTRESAMEKRAVEGEGIATVDWAARRETGQSNDDARGGTTTQMKPINTSTTAQVKQSHPSDRSDSSEDAVQMAPTRNRNNRRTAVIQGEVFGAGQPASSNTKQVQTQHESEGTSRPVEVQRPATSLSAPLDASHLGCPDCHEKSLETSQTRLSAWMPGAYPESSIGTE